MAGLLRRGLVEEGLAADVARTGDDAPVDGGCNRVRRDRSRRDAPWHGRLRGLPPSPRIGNVVTRSHAHRARFRRRPGRGTRRGRRRLPHEAVLLRRASRAPARAPATRAGRAADDRRGRRPAPRSRHAPGVARRDRNRPVLQGVRAARDIHATTREVLSRYQLLEHCWDYAYENRSNVVDVYVRYLREKIDRPFGRDSIETVRGAGYRLRREPGRERDEPASDPRALDPRVRRGHGSRARRGRRVPLLPARLFARRSHRRGAPGPRGGGRAAGRTRRERHSRRGS